MATFYLLDAAPIAALFLRDRGQVGSDGAH
jgi:hypothetical protein